MSAKSVQEIIGRAVTDSEFRTLLKDNPEEALKSYDLTEEEKDSLLKMSHDQVKVLSQSLDKRITKGFANIG